MIIEKFQEFVDKFGYSGEIDYALNIKRPDVKIDFSKLAEFDYEFANNLLDNFQHYYSIINKYMPVTIRFFNIPESCDKNIWKLRAQDVGKFVSIKGYIKTISNVFHYAKSITYSCPKCSNLIKIRQKTDKIIIPSRCSCGKRKGFEPVSKEMSDIQKLVLEEDSLDLDGTQTPRSIVVKLRDDLCCDNIDKHLQPSKKILITGIVDDEPLKKDSIEFKKYVDAHNVEIIDSNHQKYEFTHDEIKKFEEVSKSKTLYKDMAQSIYPSIHGNEIIKQSLFLQLIGGVHLYSGKNKINERGNLHILLIGSPGGGKTQLIKSSAMYLNNSKFTSGVSSTGIGLIASVTKDPDMGGWILEAGSLPRANKSILVADEIDKAKKEDLSMLNNAMIDCFIVVDKANIHQRLETDTSILAAANPKHRVFDKFEPVWKQIDLSKDFMDRFDLIFPIDDISSESEQRKVAGKIFSKYRKTELTEPKYPPEFVKKYIAYARQTYKPSMNSEVEEYITNNFIKLMAPKSKSEESAYLSSRLITNIIRLTQAAAKARLMPTTSPKDADKALEILLDSLKRQDILQEDQTIDFQRLEDVTPKPKREKMFVIKSTINKLCDESESGKAETQLVITKIKDKIPNMDEMEIESVIEKMKRKGEIYEPKQGFIKTI